MKFRANWMRKLASGQGIAMLCMAAVVMFACSTVSIAKQQASQAGFEGIATAIVAMPCKSIHAPAPRRKQCNGAHITSALGARSRFSDRSSSNDAIAPPHVKFLAGFDGIAQAVQPEHSSRALLRGSPFWTIYAATMRMHN